ncbi:MAG: hypothetical protein R3Y06_04595 [Faecalibacterium sp.]
MVIIPLLLMNTALLLFLFWILLCIIGILIALGLVGGLILKCAKTNKIKLWGKISLTVSAIGLLIISIGLAIFFIDLKKIKEADEIATAQRQLATLQEDFSDTLYSESLEDAVVFLQKNEGYVITDNNFYSAIESLDLEKICYLIDYGYSLDNTDDTYLSSALYSPKYADNWDSASLVIDYLMEQKCTIYQEDGECIIVLALLHAIISDECLEERDIAMYEKFIAYGFDPMNDYYNGNSFYTIFQNSLVGARQFQEGCPIVYDWFINAITA